MSTSLTADPAGLVILLIAVLLVAASMALLIYTRRKYPRTGGPYNVSEGGGDLGEALKARRAAANYTQEYVAETLGVSRQAVSKWESGTSEPSTANLMALARLYQVTVDELLGGPAPTSGEYHLDQRGWIRNATVLSVAVCAVGTALSVTGWVIAVLWPILLGLICAVAGVALFGLASPHMGEGQRMAWVNFGSIACWLVVPVITIWINWVGFWQGRSVWNSLGEHIVLDLLISGLLCVALGVCRLRLARAAEFRQKAH